MSENNKKHFLLFGEPRFDENENKVILEATLTFIKTSERFSGSLFEWYSLFEWPKPNRIDKYYNLTEIP